MALYMVERDLGAVSSDQLRLDQRAVASACRQLNDLGRRVRYINSAIVPTDGRALDLFGAQSAELFKEVHAVAQVGDSGPDPRLPAADDVPIQTFPEGRDRRRHD